MLADGLGLRVVGQYGIILHRIMVLEVSIFYLLQRDYISDIAMQISQAKARPPSLTGHDTPCK